LIKENSSAFKNSLGRTRWYQKPPQLEKVQCLPSAGNGTKEDPKDLRSPSSHSGVGPKRFLEEAMQSFNPAILLRMVSSGLVMQNVKHIA
jgi:hypothetical protein